jgi:hypothetical protein
MSRLETARQPTREVSLRACRVLWIWSRIASSVGGMDLQPGDTWRACWWKPEDVCEVRVQRNEHPSGFDGEGTDFPVRFSRKTHLRYGVGVVALIP